MPHSERDERISVPISGADRKRLQRRADALGSREGPLAAVLLHRALSGVGDLVKGELDEIDREEHDAGEAGS
jgi:hypothetical protein